MTLNEKFLSEIYSEMIELEIERLKSEGNEDELADFLELKKLRDNGSIPLYQDPVVFFRSKLNINPNGMTEEEAIDVKRFLESKD